MLVLSRRVGESIVIGDDVTVTVLEVRGDVIRVGIDAPRSVRVHRAELLEQVGDSNRGAASPASSAVDQLRGALAGKAAREGREGREGRDPQSGAPDGHAPRPGLGLPRPPRPEGRPGEDN